MILVDDYVALGHDSRLDYCAAMRGVSSALVVFYVEEIDEGLADLEVGSYFIDG